MTKCKLTVAEERWLHQQLPQLKDALVFAYISASREWKLVWHTTKEEIRKHTDDEVDRLVKTSWPSAIAIKVLEVSP